MSLEPAPSSNRDVPRLVITLLTGAALAVASLFVWSKPKPPAASDAPTESRTQPIAAEPPPLPSPPNPQPSAAQMQLPAATVAPPSAAPEPPTESHPITSEHVALQRERALVGALNDAVDLRDVPALRRLIEEYNRAVPDDPNALGAGYLRIADCLEQPGEASRNAARAYYERERASTLRRFVRRACFDNE